MDDRNTLQDDGFAAQVSGTQPRPIDRDLSTLLQDNYAVADLRRGVSGPAPTLPGGWARMGDDDLRALGIDPAMQHDAKSGFDASFYRDPQGHVVLAFAGTDEGKDWKHNLGQGLGFDDPQYRQSIELAKKAKVMLGDDLILTGHSLGGGLAAAAALASDTPAVTFNASGVHNKTLERAGLDPKEAKAYAAEGLIRSYAVKNELLTYLQEDSFPLKYAMPDAPGHRITLPDPEPLGVFERLVPGRMLMHRLDLHYIDAVMQAQDQAGLGARASTAEGASAPTANRLLDDAVRGLAPQRQRLGLQDDEAFLNTAASLAADARREGLRRIDHVLPGRQGEAVFAVQGGLADPTQRRSAVDLAQASAEPARDSAAQLRQQESPQLAQAAQHEPHRRALQA